MIKRFSMFVNRGRLLFLLYISAPLPETILSCPLVRMHCQRCLCIITLHNCYITFHCPVRLFSCQNKYYECRHHFNRGYKNLCRISESRRDNTVSATITGRTIAYIHGIFFLLVLINYWSTYLKFYPDSQDL